VSQTHPIVPHQLPSAPIDPVSGPLQFYEVDERRRRWYVPWWGVAHMRYWSDKAFYAAIAEAFLV